MTQDRVRTVAAAVPVGEVVAHHDGWGHHGPMTTWGSFAAAEPELAAFVAERLRAAPSYLATVRATGAPRVHPVTPIFTADGLYLFMEPTSPKGADLRQRGWFALHNGVPDSAGTGGRR